MTVSLITQRIFYDGSDISIKMSDYRTGDYDISYVVGKYLHLGTNFPFNNIWVDLTKNANHTPGNPIIQVWYGNAWVSVVDIFDGTSGMQSSGRISWSLDIFKGWDCEQLSKNVGLTGTNVYNRYWLRMSWAAHFDTKLHYIGQKFSDDTTLQSLYPDLMQADLLDGFKTGKTNWNEQHFMAAEAIVKELRSRNIIFDRGQLLDWTVFEDASCHKVAEIVYRSFGTPYKDHANEAKKLFGEEISKKALAIDTNANGHVDPFETTDRQGWISR